MQSSLLASGYEDDATLNQHIRFGDSFFGDDQVSAYGSMPGRREDRDRDYAYGAIRLATTRSKGKRVTGADSEFQRKGCSGGSGGAVHDSGG